MACTPCLHSTPITNFRLVGAFLATYERRGTFYTQSELDLDRTVAAGRRLLEACRADDGRAEGAAGDRNAAIRRPWRRTDGAGRRASSRGAPRCDDPVGSLAASSPR